MARKSKLYKGLMDKLQDIAGKAINDFISEINIKGKGKLNVNIIDKTRNKSISNFDIPININLDFSKKE
jgi:hypothetical protein